MIFGCLAVLAVPAGAGLVSLRGKTRPSVIPTLLAFATGALLSVALLDLIPEAQARQATWSMPLVLVAIVGFFLLEKWLLWRHCHSAACEAHSVAGYLILVGDGLHNAVDGLALGAAFATDERLGLAVGAAVLAHEIPQEVGDFVLLIESGLAPARALAYNVLSGLVIFPGIVVGNLLTQVVEPAAGLVLALAAGGFLYVALADLVPNLHRRGVAKGGAPSLAPLLLGIGVIWLVGRLEP